MNVHVVSAHEWLYPDSQIPDLPVTSLSLSVGRGARAACQVLLTPATPGADITWSFEPGCDWPAEIEVAQLLDVAVEHNTRDFGFVVRDGDPKAEHVTRQVPFRVYDAIRPIPDGGAARGMTEALYVRWMIPVDAAPGTLTGKLTINVGSESVELPVAVEVSPAIVPARETLRIVNWFNAGNMASRHGLEPWSDGHWAMIGQYAKLMRSLRQTDFIPAAGIDVSRRDDGSFEFNHDRVERMIQQFLSLGFQWINGPHVAGRVAFEAPEFVVGIDGEQVRATGPEGYNYLAQRFSAWRTFLDRNGWLDRTVQHIADEPTEKSAEDYRVLAGIARKFMPGKPLMDAVGLPELGGALDIWVPIENQLYEQLDGFEAQRKHGDTLWYYTCCIPGGKYLNRLLDMPLIRCRYLHWANYVYDLPGYLHRGLNAYRGDQDPFEQTCGVHGGPGSQEPWLPAGDTHIVYPGEDGPMSSVRAEAEAIGAEDYELLRIVEARDKATADDIAHSCLRSFQDYDEDGEKLTAVHKRLLAAAS